LAPTPTPTSAPVSQSTPGSLPEQAFLASMNHEYQKLNNCGPVSLAPGFSGGRRQLLRVRDHPVRRGRRGQREP
jgi:hypothetical protein